MMWDIAIKNWAGDEMTVDADVDVAAAIDVYQSPSVRDTAMVMSLRSIVVSLITNLVVYLQLIWTTSQMMD